MSRLDLPVIIVGAGPVGLSLLVGLQRQGIAAQLYEQLPDLSPEARASTFHPHTLEIFEEWGVLDAIVSQGHRVDCLQYWERDNQELIAAFSYSHINCDTPYPYRLQCPQSIVTRVLKPIVESTNPNCVYMQHELIGFEEKGDYIIVTFQTPHGIVNVKGAYLVAADGSKSAIRRQLNISFEGSTYEDRFLLVASDVDFTPFYPEFGPVSYIFSPEEWVIVMQLPDITRTVFQVHPHEVNDVIVQPDEVRQRMARFAGSTIDFTIESVSIYSVHQRVASTFRLGRVLLVGDAAHINNPMGGMGMNSGIHDAHCLAGYLAQVMSGASDTLLDDYSNIRRDYALKHVRKTTHKNYEDMSSQNEEYRQKRNAEFRAIAADPQRQREYLLKASMLEDRIAEKA